MLDIPRILCLTASRPRPPPSSVPVLLSRPPANLRPTGCAMPVSFVRSRLFLKIRIYGRIVSYYLGWVRAVRGSAAPLGWDLVLHPYGVLTSRQVPPFSAPNGFQFLPRVHSFLYTVAVASFSPFTSTLTVHLIIVGFRCLFFHCLSLCLPSAHSLPVFLLLSLLVSVDFVAHHVTIGYVHVFPLGFSPSIGAPLYFLRIPRGNIDLRSEIRLDAVRGVVQRDRERGSLRRMYSARVVGHNEPMTVALYQGDNAEQEWRRDLSRHSRLWHPHILQIYASASWSGIYATVFHDDLVLFAQFVDTFRHSAVLKSYFLWHMNADLQAAGDYCVRILPVEERFSTCWIRRSTGRLCLEFSTSETNDGFRGKLTAQLQSQPQPMLSLHDPNLESLVIASLGYPEWYSLCESYLHFEGIPFEHAVEIASVKDARIMCSGWNSLRRRKADNGATRFNSRDVCNNTLHLDKRCDRAWWLAQGNHIFNRLAIVSDHVNYKLVHYVKFTLAISETTQNPPNGYLFVPSPKDFETSPISVRWPDRPAYWSLDPSGSIPLSPEEASRLGFPSITPITQVYASSWDESVYAGIRKFDESKGFVPESQELAKELGYPLYEVCVQASHDWHDCDYSNSYSEEEYADEATLDQVFKKLIGIVQMYGELANELQSDEKLVANQGRISAANQRSIRERLVAGLNDGVHELQDLARGGVPNLDFTRRLWPVRSAIWRLLSR
ncbi:hypothetical protein MSAN_01101100 [Mycena sanguinolenta]|uniref:Uncharacterized protein n=1 Tax=Mycena sanguinolenta TaxID=230812 RepID=A0A8H7D6T2_9AGAR|nr:hypothetical protein MSAN_01101100 [Mycena sanguinolenta]